MKREELTEQAERALEDLGKQLSEGNSESLKNYVAAMARFPDYSWGNVALICSQRPEATLVAGYQAWKGLGRQVKRGEKAIGIRAPLVYSAQESPENERELRGFKVAHVFDVSQTEGEPLPQPEKIRGDPEQALSCLKAFVAELGLELVHSGSLQDDGRSYGGRIELSTRLTRAAEFSVLAHELAHEILHQNEEPQCRPTKAVRETEAEAVAFAISTSVGLDPGRSSSDYILLFDGSRETLSASLERIHATVSRIAHGIAEQREHLQQHEQQETTLCP